jgi:uncharacterized protein (TIGR02246 family)
MQQAHQEHLDDILAIERQLAARTDAWNRGDAAGFTVNFQDHGTFTNVAGSAFSGRDAFEGRIHELLSGIFADSSMQTTIRDLRFVRPDVAVVGVDSEIRGFGSLPAGIRTDDDVFRSRQLWVLVKEAGEWWMAAFHNVDVKLPRAA